MNITMRLSVVRNELQDALRQQQCILQRLSSDAQLLDLLVEREANIFGKYVPFHFLLSVQSYQFYTSQNRQYMYLHSST